MRGSVLRLLPWVALRLALRVTGSGLLLVSWNRRSWLRRSRPRSGLRPVVGHLLIAGVRLLLIRLLRVRLLRVRLLIACALRLLRIADSQIVVHHGHARHLGGNRLGQFAGVIARNGSRQRHLALNGGRGDQVALQRLGGIEGMDYVHLDLAVRSGWGRACLLGQRHRAAQ